MVFAFPPFESSNQHLNTGPFKCHNLIDATDLASIRLKNQTSSDGVSHGNMSVTITPVPRFLVDYILHSSTHCYFCGCFYSKIIRQVHSVGAWFLMAVHFDSD